MSLLLLTTNNSNDHLVYGMSYTKSAFTSACSSCTSAFGQFTYDGSQFLYTTALGAGNNLLKIDLTGSPPQTITTISVGAQPKFASYDNGFVYYVNGKTIYKYDGTTSSTFFGTGGNSNLFALTRDGFKAVYGKGSSLSRSDGATTATMTAISLDTINNGNSVIYDANTDTVSIVVEKSKEFDLIHHHHHHHALSISNHYPFFNSIILRMAPVPLKSSSTLIPLFQHWYQVQPQYSFLISTDM